MLLLWFVPTSKPTQPSSCSDGMTPGSHGPPGSMPPRLTPDLMKMRVLQVETEEQKEVARQLQPGRVFENGRAFTPFARREVFSKLVEFEGGDASTGNARDASAQSSGAASISKWRTSGGSSGLIPSRD